MHDDLSIPQSLRRENTPESKAAVTRLINESRRRGITRVVQTSGGRSTLSLGHAANLDEVGKAILREETKARREKQKERFARLRELKGLAMAQKIGPKETERRERREEKARTGKPKKAKVTSIDALAEAIAPKPVVSDVTDISMAEMGMAPGAFDVVPESKHVQHRKAVKAARAKLDENAKPAKVKGTKTELIAGLLKRKGGCTSADVLKATGWPAVSMPQQAKAAGLKLRKEKAKGEPTRYYAA